VVEAVDFLLVAPLAEERLAVLAELPGHRQLPPERNSILVYYRAAVPAYLSDGTEGRYSIVVVSPLGMGRVSAATAVGEALSRFTPRYVILVGIAGGVAGEAKIGDVLVSEQIVDYELQKLLPEGPEVRFAVYRADAALLAAVQNRLPVDWFVAVKAKRPRRGQPARYIGPVASGDKVVAVKSVLARYQAAWPKLIGVETEAGGVAGAVSTRSQPPGLLMI